MNDVKYLCVFELPDGKHVAVVSSGPDERLVREHISWWHPEIKIHTLKRLESLDEVNAAVAALREEDPSRPLATDLHPTNPNAILHNQP